MRDRLNGVLDRGHIGCTRRRDLAREVGTRESRARLEPAAWPLPSVHRVIGALAGMDEVELRATLNGGLGMVAVVPSAGVAASLEVLAGRDVPAWLVGEVVPAAALDGGRYAEVGAPGHA